MMIRIIRRRRMAVGVVAVAIALTGATAALVTAGPASAAAGWTATTLTSSTPGDNLLLNGVDARTNTDAWIVGAQYPNTQGPVAFHWSGSTWSQVPVPPLSTGVNDSLNAVSASSATDAWAVGDIFSTPRSGQTLLEHWNGKAWSVDSADSLSAGGASLTSVLDLSPTNAYTIGLTRTSALIEHWNGTSWSAVTLPDPNFFPSSLTGLSASDVWMVGASHNKTTGANTEEALHFNGTMWTVLAMASAGLTNPAFTAATEVGPDDVWAVGSDTVASPVITGTLIEHWNGSTWAVVPSPNLGDVNRLGAVAGRSSGDAYATGGYEIPNTADPIQTSGMILRWNGSAWAVDAPGSPQASGAAATFPGAATEWIVGGNGVVLSHS
jgi:hypothetical protein